MDFYARLTEQLYDRAPQLIRDFPTRFSGVCIPIIDTEDGPSILFEVRSGRLHSQPLDICFPGGMAEEGELPYENALREICEELKIDPGQVTLLCPSDRTVVGNLQINPFAVHVTDYHMTFSTDEVAEVFTVPLKWFPDHPAECYTVNYEPVLPENFPVSRIQGGAAYKFRPRREFIYFYNYGNHCIWGLTAKLLHRFLELIQDII